MNITDPGLPCAHPAATPATPIVFVVDDDASARESLASLIRSAGWHPRFLSSAREFLTLPSVHHPCCLLLAVDLPDLSGLDLQRRVSDRTDLPIIFIGGPGDISTMVKAMKAGAIEFLTKPLRHDLLTTAMREAIDWSRAEQKREAGLSVLRERYAALSRREREVVELVLSGWRNKQIAASLGIREITVKVHRATMMRKMGADSFLDLVKIAMRLRVMPVPKTERSSSHPLDRELRVASEPRASFSLAVSST